MKRSITLIFLLLCGFVLMQAQSWYVYDGSVVPDQLDEWGASSNDPGVNFVEEAMDDPYEPGNKIFKYVQPDVLSADGSEKARKYYRMKFNNGEATQVTVVFRMKGIPIDSLSDERVTQFDMQVPYRDVLNLKSEEKLIDLDKVNVEVPVDMDFNEWHLYRATIDATGNVAIYVDEDPVAVVTGVSSDLTSNNFVRFGDGGSARVAGYTDWILVDTSGVYAPGEGEAIPDSCSTAIGPDVPLVPSGADLQTYIDETEDGGVLTLASGAVYETETLEIHKSITIKAEDGAAIRPVITQTSTNGIKFGADKSGAEIIFKGIEFNSTDSRYLCRFATGDSLALLEFNDVVAHGYDRSFIRASDSGIFLDSIIVHNCYIYNFDEGGQTYRLIYLDKGDCPVKYFKASNSSFVGFNRTFLQINSPDTRKTVIVDQCNIHGRSDSREDDLFDVDGAPGSSFTLSNSIISSIKLGLIWDVRDNVTDSIMNVYYHDIDSVQNIGNTWSYEAAFTATDPLFINAAAGALYLDPASPALTASTTGGVIGDPRWAVAPAMASLLELTVDAGMMQAFTPDKLDYNVIVPYGTTTLNVDAVAVYADATITGTGAVDVSSGAATADVVVTGSDASSATYSLSIEWEGPEATLSALVPDVGSIVPAFDPAVFSYELVVPIGTDTVFFSKTTLDANADVVGTDTVDVQTGSGTATFEVESDNAIWNLNYEVNIRYASTDATLSELVPDVGVLTPAFDAVVLDYTIDLLAVDTVFFDYAVAQGGATVAGTDTIDVSSGSGTATFVVTAEDGTTTQTYTVVITSVQPSDDATLSGLVLSVGTLTPEFDAAVYSYTAEVPEGTTTVTVGATATDDEGAEVTGTGQVDVSSGSGTATVVVTAADGETTLTYTVEITVAVGVENTLIHAVHMYYNRQSDQLILENSSDVESIDIFTITGKKMLTLETHNNATLEISTSDLIDGIYLVRMKLSENGIQSGKFVK